MWLALTLYAIAPNTYGMTKGKVYRERPTLECEGALKIESEAVFWNGNLVKMTPRARQLFDFLVAHPNAFYSMSELAVGLKLEEQLGVDFDIDRFKKAAGEIYSVFHQVDANFASLRRWPDVGYAWDTGVAPTYQVIEDFEVDVDLLEVRWKAQRLDLRASQIRLLMYFLSHPGQWLKPQELYEARLSDPAKRIRLERDPLKVVQVEVANLIKSLRKIDPTFDRIHRKQKLMLWQSETTR